MFTNQGSYVANQFLLSSAYPQLVIPDEIIDELISRFVMNIPVEERQDAIRVCFQIELAHWFFVDNYCGEDKPEFWKRLGLIKFPAFAALVFQRTPFLQKEVGNIDKIVQNFREYKMKVPTFGAILMDQDLTKVVLVQGFGGQWGFPKGKINKDEDPADCAAREVLEETGYDCSPLLNRNHFIESCCNERWTRLYIIRGVDRNFIMKPHTRYEIKNIGWFDISELPENKKDPSVITRPGFPHTAFHNVFPYIKRLRRWIEDKRSGRNDLEYFKSNAPNRPDRILDRGDGARSTKKKRDSGSDKEKLLKASAVPSQGPNGQVGSKSRQKHHQTIQLLDMLATPSEVSKSQQKPPDTQGKSGATENPNAFAKNINPKRRLFVSDEEGDEIVKMTKLKISDSARKSSPLSKNHVQDAITEKFLVSSPSWLNFKLDAEEVIRSMALKPTKAHNRRK